MAARRIFQTWKSKTDLPENFAYWRSTVIAKNPEFEHVLWDDADNRGFVAETFPWFLPTYDGYPAEIFRVDAVRYFHLYAFGGAYLDLDVECLKSLSPLADIEGVVLGRMGQDESFEHSIPNAVMLSDAREEFWLLVIAMMMTETRRTHPELATGPALLWRAVNAYGGGYDTPEVREAIKVVRTLMGPHLADRGRPSPVTIAPSWVLFPLSWADPIHNHGVRRPLLRSGRLLDPKTVKAMFPDAIAVTYWTHSWEPHGDLD